MTVALAIGAAVLIAMTPEISSYLYGNPPSGAQVQADFMRSVKGHPPIVEVEVNVRRTSVAEQERNWVRMYVLFDLASSSDLTIRIGGEQVSVKGGVLAVAGEASLDYMRSAEVGWSVTRITLDRSPHTE